MLPSISAWMLIWITSLGQMKGQEPASSCVSSPSVSDQSRSFIRLHALNWIPTDDGEQALDARSYVLALAEVEWDLRQRCTYL